MKTLLRFLLFLLLLALAALAGYLFLDSSETRNTFTFVPDDFVYVIESDQPVKDWQGLSQSEVWQVLKTNDYFADISTSADYLDSLLNNNQTLVKLIRLGDLVISAHMVSSQDYEFIFLVDLREGGKLGKLQAFLTPLFESLDYDVSRSSFFNIDLVHLTDPASDETLSLSIVDNVLVGSYEEELVRKAISQTERASIMDDNNFAMVRDRTNRGDLYTLYLNYQTLDELILAYTPEMPAMLEGLEEILTFSSFDFGVSDQEATLRGYMKQVDSVPSFLSVFKEVGTGRVKAHQVLPAQTAFFSSIGFDDFEDFYLRLMRYYEENQPEEHKKLTKNIQRTEKFLKIDFKEDFFSWMTEELVTAAIPVDSFNQQYEFYALLHFDDYDYTREKLDFVREQIRKRTPLKFRQVDYRGFEIQYLDLDGFFKLFFKKMFSRIEKPHYTYIDDYVVFSNDTSSLQFVIDEYLKQHTLGSQESYEAFRDNFSSKSSIFSYIQMPTFYNYLIQSLDAQARGDMAKHKPYLMSFPHIGFQVSPSSNMYETYLLGSFVPDSSLLEAQPMLP